MVDDVIMVACGKCGKPFGVSRKVLTESPSGKHPVAPCPDCGKAVRLDKAWEAERKREAAEKRRTQDAVVRQQKQEVADQKADHRRREREESRQRFNANREVAAERAAELIKGQVRLLNPRRTIGNTWVLVVLRITALLIFAVGIVVGAIVDDRDGFLMLVGAVGLVVAHDMLATSYQSVDLLQRIENHLADKSDFPLDNSI